MDCPLASSCPFLENVLCIQKPISNDGCDGGDSSSRCLTSKYYVRLANAVIFDWFFMLDIRVNCKQACSEEGFKGGETDMRFGSVVQLSPRS